jgi:SAM-dependent MidA family methyltransferase
MELALYAPGLGYYSGGKAKFGAAGDFVTAPEAYPLFGRCLARTAADVLAGAGVTDILEAGAGSGRLAAVLLNELAALGSLPPRYYILELSASLRAHQATTLKRQAPQHADRVRWLDRLPDPGFRGLVLANELLDALPVERFHATADGVRQLRVTWREDRFDWSDAAAPAAMRARIAPLQLPPDYTSEIGFAAEAWVRSVGERLAAGVILLIDYGFPRAEYYNPDRAGGTLMCHYRHRAHADPLILVGLQDITAHLDFSALAAAGAEAGLELLGYTSQAAFLLASGLDALARDSDPNDVRAHLALTAQIKKLTLPHEMGELYKAFALGRELSEPLKAFALQDRRARL